MDYVIQIESIKYLCHKQVSTVQTIQWSVMCSSELYGNCRCATASSVVAVTSHLSPHCLFVS